MQINMRFIVFSMLLFLSSWAYGAGEEPPKIGNFALPISQDPAPLFSFGQNIIDKDQTMLFLFADNYAGVNKYYIDVIPALLYGITDDTSIIIGAPIAKYKQDNNRSSGLEDAIIQLEKAFYAKSTSSFTEQATIVGNITLPSGSVQKNPSTGYGSPSFFLGATYSRMYVDWFLFTSHGAILTTAQDNTKYGNSFLYQYKWSDRSQFRRKCCLRDTVIMGFF